MEHNLTRRNFFHLTAGVFAASRTFFSKEEPTPFLPPVNRFNSKSVVALTSGNQRRKIVSDSLLAIEEQILPKLQQKKYVVIKPNLVSTVNPLAATHADALHGILDFLGPRFKGQVIIAESSAGNTWEGFDNFHYQQVVAEHKTQQVTLLDLNQDGKYETLPILNADLHVVPVRLAARLLDPEAFVICSAILKTHNTVVATLSVKNMTLGAPLRSAPKTSRWNDKRLYHGGVRQTHYDMLLTTQKMRPYWGAAVIDGFEGMEGNGPASGLPVPSRVAIASTDFIAADRVGLEVMGINPAWVGYLNYCAQCGLGQYDLAQMEIRGSQLSKVTRKYQLHEDIERELQWMGPMTELPPKLG
ncbi:MAG TPA: DUF362 domain-containing protein [Terriglobia bacterium]|nr:DUF362 domain-containing protein [Terriglobia bacterium]